MPSRPYRSKETLAVRMQAEAGELRQRRNRWVADSLFRSCTHIDRNNLPGAARIAPSDVHQIAICRKPEVRRCSLGQQLFALAIGRDQESAPLRGVTDPFPGWRPSRFQDLTTRRSLLQMH